jgi:hypothetical protein
MKRNPSLFLKIGFFATFLLALCACSRAETTFAPTLAKTVTIIPSTSVVVIPTLEPQPTLLNVTPTVTSTLSVLTPIVIEQPTHQATATLNPIATGYVLPPALLQVEKPGDFSMLVSPFLVTANVYPGEDGMVNVQLFGEDGRLMSDHLIQLSKVESGWVSLATEIKFEPISAGESALVVISTRDAFGRRIGQTGIPVTLLQIGKSEIENPHFNKQPAQLKSPVAGGFYKKGTVRVEGLIHLFNANPVIVELITQTGGILANKPVYVEGREGTDFVPFAFDLPYSVTKRTPVRFTLRQASTLSPNVDISLYSMVIFLDP